MIIDTYSMVSSIRYLQVIRHSKTCGSWPLLLHLCRILSQQHNHRGNNSLRPSALAVFVQPPSVNELERRLRHRSTETEEKIRQRLDKAHIELAKANEFDVIIVNEDLEKAIDEAANKVKSFIH